MTEDTITTTKYVVQFRGDSESHFKELYIVDLEKELETPYLHKAKVFSLTEARAVCKKLAKIKMRTTIYKVEVTYKMDSIHICPIETSKRTVKRGTK